MANSRIPGPLRVGGSFIDDGTSCRAPSPVPGPIGFSPLAGAARGPVEFLADGEIELDDALGYAWISALAANASQLPKEHACYYAVCRADLRDPDSGSPFGRELVETLTAGTNLPGNVVGVATTAWASATAGKVLTAAEAEALRAAMREGIKVGVDLANGGRAEVYDANAFRRRAARGAARKAFPPKLRLRLKDVKALDVSSRVPVRGGLPRIDLSDKAIKTLSSTLSEADWKRGLTRGLPLRRLIAGNAVGLLLAVGPAAIDDFRSSQVNGSTDWRRFAVEQARNQSGNIVGFGISVLMVPLLGMVITMSAPVALGAALIVGVLGQTGFNASGADDYLATRVDRLFK